MPPSILFIPLATMVFNFGLYDSPLALILTYPTFLIPFCTWLLIGYFKSIPYELEECALIDGATRLQILWKITLPLAVPGLISAGIFAFTLSWNEFIYALAFIQSAENKTVPVAVLTQLVEGDVYHWGSLMAGALLGSIPVALVLLLLRRALRLEPDRRGEGIRPECGILARGVPLWHPERKSGNTRGKRSCVCATAPETILMPKRLKPAPAI